MTTARAYAAFNKSSPLGPHTIERRDVGDRDVAIDILFCGVCHSDLHTARAEWTGTTYPCVPGHEIVGRVTRVGSGVTGFKAGETAAVGCMVDSCHDCGNCRDGYEQFCDVGTTWTYNDDDLNRPGHVTYGGYSTHIVVDERFCLHMPTSLDLAAGAPLLCAGITMYSPLRHWGAERGRRVGIVGLGGLGHMGVKLAHALGAETVVFTRSRAKVDDAKRLGADDVVLSTDAAAMQRRAASFDLLVDTVATSHNLDDYLSLLRRDGTLALVGIPEDPHPAPRVGRLMSKRRSLAGSSIGGIAETQEMLDYCAARDIVCDIERIRAQDVNDAYARMLRSDVRYRFVIDIASIQ